MNLWANNGQQISGNYSALLVGGFTAPAATISQTGLVPNGTASILFEAQAGVGGFTVTLGGENIPFYQLSQGSNYTLYGGNVAAFAGLTEPLTFSALEDLNGLNYWNIDDIQFSPAAVPEPNSFGLLALGGLLLAWRHWRKSSPKVSPGEH